MKKKSHIPVMYMLVAIYITFQLFDVLGKDEIAPIDKLSYIFLIIVPLALIILAVWHRNSRKEFSAFAPTAIYTPLSLASALLGAGLLAGPWYAAAAAVVGAVLAFLGINRIRNMAAPKTLVSIDVPDDEAARIERRLAYEPFMKFGLVPDRKQLETASMPAAAVHLILGRDPSLFEEMAEKGLAAEQLGESPKELPACLKDPGRRWCAVGLNPLVIAVNPVAWKKRLETDAAPMRSLDTLLSPNLVGSFALPDPEKSLAGFMLLAGLVRLRGETEGMAFLAELKKHAARMLADPVDVREVFANAEILAVAGLLNDFLKAASWRNPLMLGIPEGAPWEMAMAAIPRASPAPEQSAAFLDFLAGKAGNEVFASKALLMPAHPKALRPYGCPPPELGDPDYEFNLGEALAGRSELLRKWKGHVA